MNDVDKMIRDAGGTPPVNRVPDGVSDDTASNASKGPEDAERSQPVRRKYEKCGSATTMGQSIAETYARDPTFYAEPSASDADSVPAGRGNDVQSTISMG